LHVRERGRGKHKGRATRKNTPFFGGTPIKFYYVDSALRKHHKRKRKKSQTTKTPETTEKTRKRRGKKAKKVRREKYGYPWGEPLTTTEEKNERIIPLAFAWTKGRAEGRRVKDWVKVRG